ncbi:hypothetical protein [uncultured Cocleimonas sp.]|nr:hypothetical protein [uncultured Cocleimonas sp.]
MKTDIDVKRAAVGKKNTPCKVTPYFYEGETQAFIFIRFLR